MIYISSDIAYYKNYVTPQMYGAKGDGITDDTAAINACIKASDNNGKIYFPAGTYLVSSSMSDVLEDNIRFFAINIWEKDNLSIEMSSKAYIKHKMITEEEVISAGQTRYYIFGIYYSSNIKLTGGNIIGEYDEHTYHIIREETGTYGATHGYGISLGGSSNIYIKNINITNCYGDGIKISVGTDQSTKCKNIIVDGCKIYHCARQGITIGGAIDTIIKNTEIYDIAGAMPQCGIDLEPNYVSQSNINILFDNIYIHDVGVHALTAYIANEGIKIINSRFYNKLRFAEGTTKAIVNNCEIIELRTLNEESNIISDCIIGYYDHRSHIGDTFNRCIFDPNYFDGIKESFSTNITELVGNYDDSGAVYEFTDCSFKCPIEQTSNFLMFRFQNSPKKIIFQNCKFTIDMINQQNAFNINNGDAIFINNTFTTDLSDYHKMFMRIEANNIIFKNNIIDVSNIETYNSDNSSLIRSIGKNALFNGNIFKANSAISSHPFKHSFVDENNLGELYYINNYANLWDNIASMPDTYIKLITLNNILSTITPDNTSTVPMEITYTDGSSETLEVVVKI